MEKTWHAFGPKPKRRLLRRCPTDSVAFATDGKTIAAAGWDYEVSMWCSHSGTPLPRLIGHRAPAFSVTFSSDGGIIITAGMDEAIKLWDANTYDEKSTIHHGQGRDVCFACSPCSPIFALGTESAISLWDYEKEEQIECFETKGKSVSSLAFSWNGETLLCALRDGSLLILKSPELSRLGTIPGKGRVNAIGFRCDSKNIAAAVGGGRISVWNLHTLEEVWSWEWEKDKMGVQDVDCLASSPDGSLLLTGGQDSWGLGLVCLWEFKSGRRLMMARRNANKVASVAFSRTGRIVASGSHDGTVLIWDLNDLLPSSA